jgi:hypothetical protein
MASIPGGAGGSAFGQEDLASSRARGKRQEGAGYHRPVARVFSTDILRGVPRVTGEV